jgi:hypothetical protein
MVSVENRGIITVARTSEGSHILAEFNPPIEQEELLSTLGLLRALRLDEASKVKSAVALEAEFLIGYGEEPDATIVEFFNLFGENIGYQVKDSRVFQLNIKRFCHGRRSR